MQVTVIQSGSGAQAVGQGHIVAGAGGKSAGGNIYDFSTIYQGVSPQNDAETITAYLRWLERTHAAVRINEIIKGVAGTDADPLQLRSVFVDLNVTLKIEEGISLVEHFRRERERTGTSKASRRNRFPTRQAEMEDSPKEQVRTTRAVSVFEALGFHPRLVLIGDAGCGKSTVGQFLTLALSRAQLQDSSLLTRLGVTWTHGPLLPVPLVLREFAASLSANHARGCANDIWEYLGKNLVNCGQPARWVESIRKTAADEGALFLLDGWDETHDLLRLTLVAEALADLVKNTPTSCRFLLTSRPYAWDGVLLAAEEKDDAGLARLDSALVRRMQTAFKTLHAQLPTHYEVAKLDPPQIESFIEGWYRAVQEGEQPWFNANEAALKKADLETAAAREDLQPVISNPLLLTLTASLSACHLPDDRADLFNEIVELLLKRWTMRSGADKSLREAVGRDLRHEDIRQKIEGCAFAAHRGHVGQAGVADIPEAALKAAFASLLGGSDDLAKIVIEFVEKRAGLLLSKGLKAGSRQFSCPHRAFQEFLAGCHLSAKESFTSSAPVAAAEEIPSALALAREHPGHWREVLCFAARQARAERGSLAAHNLVHNRSFAEWRKQNQPTETDWRCAVVAGRQLLEIGLVPLRSTEATCLRLAHVASWLGALIEHGVFASVRERLEVSLDLAKLGDTRAGVRLKDGLPDIVFEPELPKGTFELAEDRTKFEIEHPYCVSRYPITVAQFQAFVAAGGYEDDHSAETTQRLARWWTPDGLKWKRENDITGPEDSDPVFQTPNHPRVGVSWYEAIAFCAWLAEKLKLEIRLPHEAEWEQAARWNAQRRQADNRHFPWGDAEKDVAQRCNMGDTGIGHTSAVGLFPGGNADCGAMDMSGNVWEWCENWYEDKTMQYRVLRGGSFGNVPGYLRCGGRYNGPPDYRDYYVGFRVVCVGASAR
jgi:formylglycine-generating enzyme required for sulfatase activity